MPLTIDAFRTIASQTSFGSRDIAVQGEGDKATARLGNFVFSQSSKVNAATIVGARMMTRKSLRACDVTATLSRLDILRRNRFVGELSRQLDTSPKFRELPDALRAKIRADVSKSPYEGCDLASCKTPKDMAHLAAQRINASIAKNRTADDKSSDISGRKRVEKGVGDMEPTGLRKLTNVFEKGTTSVEDRIKRGFLGAGMRVNRSNTNPVILEKLKTNGVEPGFIYRNDWSKDDTRGFMADVGSDASRAAMDALMEVVGPHLDGINNQLNVLNGDLSHRMGNEIMLDAKDLMQPL